MDMAAIMYRRARKGQSVLRPDRKHLHNIFIRAGLSSKQALAAILLMGSGYALVGIIGELYAVPEYIMFVAFIMSLLAYSYVIQHIWTIIRISKKLTSNAKP
jgi:UDP-GlcNAc:undecaprenyl-phosphate GlcNAc-1-phosphate transferase